jgi:hypothetical protein
MGRPDAGQRLSVRRRADRVAVMPGQNARQRLRQRAGFLAENLLQRYFEDRGVLSVSFARRHLDEVGERLDPLWRSKARALAEKTRGIRGVVRQTIDGALRQWDGREPPISRDEMVVRSLLGLCDMIRWEGGEPIMSEVKSQLGPAVDYRMEFQATQVIALRDCAARGIGVSILYYAALPAPEFVEIPWSDLRKPTTGVRRDQIGGGYRYRTRVPIPFRDRCRFTQIPAHLVPYSDERELLEYLRTHFGPMTRPGFEREE